MLLLLSGLAVVGVIAIWPAESLLILALLAVAEWDRYPKVRSSGTESESEFIAPPMSFYLRHAYNSYITQPTHQIELTNCKVVKKANAEQ